MDIQTRIFDTRIPMDSETFLRIESSVDKKLSKVMYHIEKQEEYIPHETNPTTISKEQIDQNLDEFLDQARTDELDRLSQLAKEHFPTNDIVAEIIMEQLDFAIDQTRLEETNDIIIEEANSISSSTSSIHSYPPINQTGQINDHDRPYADYGHLGSIERFVFCVSTSR